MEGLNLSYDYLCKNDIPHKKVGKLIVAQDEKQVCQLNELYERALQNKCPDIEIINKECIPSYEPRCKVKEKNNYQLEIVSIFFKCFQLSSLGRESNMVSMDRNS